MKDPKKFLDQAKKDIKNLAKSVVPAALEEIAKTAQQVFPEATISIVPGFKSYTIRVSSNDKDFLKKEFGSDEYKPANRSLILINKLQHKG